MATAYVLTGIVINLAYPLRPNSKATDWGGRHWQGVGWRMAPAAYCSPWRLRFFAADFAAGLRAFYENSVAGSDRPRDNSGVLAGDAHVQPVPLIAAQTRTKQPRTRRM